MISDQFTVQRHQFAMANLISGGGTIAKLHLTRTASMSASRRDVASSVLGSNRDGGVGQNMLSSHLLLRRNQLENPAALVPRRGLFTCLVPHKNLVNSFRSSPPASGRRISLPHSSLSGTKRHFTRNIDPRELGSVSLLEIKRFMRQKALEYSETHACLKLQIPRHLLLRRGLAPGVADVSPPPKEWRQLDSAFASVFINKTTGAFVCPDMALSGDWKSLQSFLLAWHHNKAAKKGEPLKDYTELQVDCLKLSLYAHPNHIFRL